MIVGKETEAMHANCINPTCDWWCDCKSTSDNNECENLAFPELKHFNVCHTTDMSAAWKLTKRGGCSKIKKFFCHCCNCVSDSLHIPNENSSAECIEIFDLHPEHSSNWTCYYKKIMSTDIKEIISRECENSNAK